ncbi:hypothetical protein BGX27_009900 [Mortierella sp. AM989]|nr:hypothetical protein BGX27_009900 [Mortierella sp. AM989]
MIVSSSLHRSETQKEADDMRYLERLIRSQSRVARLKQHAPSPLHIPHTLTYSSGIPTTAYRTSQLTTTSTASLDLPPSETVPYLHPCAESLHVQQESEHAGQFSSTTSPREETVPYIHPSFELPCNQQVKQGREYRVYPRHTVLPLRITTSAVPVLQPPNSSTPNGQKASAEIWTASTGSTMDIKVLYNPYESRVIDYPSPTNNAFDNDIATNSAISNSAINNHLRGIDTGNSGRENQATVGSHNGQVLPGRVQTHHHYYSGYNPGAPINHRAGEGQRFGVVSPTERQEHGGAFRNPSHSALNEMPAYLSRSPQMLQGSELVYQQQSTGNSRQDQTFKQTSQLLPSQYKHHQLSQQGQEANYHHETGVRLNKSWWGKQWRGVSKIMYGKRVSDLEVSATEPARVSADKELAIQEKETNSNNNNKKKNKRNTASNEPLLDVAYGYIGGEDPQRRDLEGEKAKVRLLDRPSGSIPLGFMSVFSWLFTLAYNGVLSAFVYQASRFPSDTNLPVFILSIVSIFSATLSIFGIVSTFLLYRSKSSSASARSSRVLHILFKCFYLLNFITSFLTFAGTMGWLILNVYQTGAWDRMLLKSASPDASLSELTFESFMAQDGSNPDYWIVNVKIWIPSFIFIWLVQVYFCVCLLAYGRKMQNQKKLLERRRLLMKIDMSERK